MTARFLARSTMTVFGFQIAQPSTNRRLLRLAGAAARDREGNAK